MDIDSSIVKFEIIPPGGRGGKDPSQNKMKTTMANLTNKIKVPDPFVQIIFKKKCEIDLDSFEIEGPSLSFNCPK